MRTLLLAALTLALAPAWAQKLELNLGPIAAKAQAKTELDLDGPVFTLLVRSFARERPSGLDLGLGVTGVFVRSYAFAKPGDYADSDLESLRKQLGTGSGWSRLIHVQEKDETTEVYLLGSAGKPGAFLIVSAKPKELTVVNILGSLQIAQLAHMRELVRFAIRRPRRHAAF